MKISVIIPTYNYAPYLTRCVESVYSQTYNNLECIVVNDGSTDETLQVLGVLKKKHPSLVVISKDNGGLSSARNMGIECSSGELVCFLDSDDYWMPNKLFNQIKVLSGGFDCVFSDFKFFNEHNVEFENLEDTIDNLTYYDFISRNPITGSASSIMIKRTCLKTVGLFNTKLKSLEDLEYWFRLFSNGFKFCSTKEKDVRIMRRTLGNMSTDYTTMFFSHLEVLFYQQTIIRSLNLDPFKIKMAIYSRLNKIGWYAEVQGDPILVDLVSTLKIHFCGRIVVLMNNPVFLKFKKISRLAQ